MESVENPSTEDCRLCCFREGAAAQDDVDVVEGAY